MVSWFKQWGVAPYTFFLLGLMLLIALLLRLFWPPLGWAMILTCERSWRGQIAHIR